MVSARAKYSSYVFSYNDWLHRDNLESEDYLIMGESDSKVWLSKSHHIPLEP